MSRSLVVKMDERGNIQAKFGKTCVPETWDGRGAVDLHLVNEAPRIGIVATAALTAEEAQELADFLDDFADGSLSNREHVEERWRNDQVAETQEPGFLD